MSRTPVKAEVKLTVYPGKVAAMPHRNRKIRVLIDKGNLVLDIGSVCAWLTPLTAFEFGADLSHLGKKLMEEDYASD